MLFRALATLLTVLLLATSGVAGSLSYLCRMHGELHQQCCCKHSEAEAADGSPKVQGTNRCCEVRLTDGSEPPPAARGVLHDLLELPPAIVAVSAMANLSETGSRDVEVPVRARAPPSRAGPPLFVWNCSYLI